MSVETILGGIPISLGAPHPHTHPYQVYSTIKSRKENEVLERVAIHVKKLVLNSCPLLLTNPMMHVRALTLLGTTLLHKH